MSLTHVTTCALQNQTYNIDMNNAANMSTRIPAPMHNDLSRQYGCAATMTVVTFLVHGMLHRARRFWREDMPTSGKVEIYSLEPWAGQWTTMTEFGWYDSAMCEDWLRYASDDVSNTVDSMATACIQLAIANVSAVGNMIDAAQSERFAMMEMS